MSDDEVLDVLVDFGTYDAFIDEILLGAVGPEAHDAPGPTLRETGNLCEVLKAGVVDIDPLLGWRR